MVEAQIQSVGKKAIDEKEPMLLLFDETATQGIKEVAVVQQFSKKEPIKLKEGYTISFGHQEYRIEKVGRIAEKNLNELGHVALLFTAIPDEDELLNGIYLSPHVLPQIAVGMNISYHQ